MDGMFAYRATEHAETAEALPLELRWPAFGELLARGRARGRVTRDDLDAALPPGQASAEELEEATAILDDLGIDVVTAEGSEEEEDAPARTAEAVVRAEEDEDGAGGNVSESALGRTDDPVRIFLREMGNAELLTREGEI